MASTSPEEMSVERIMELVEAYGTAIEHCMHTALHNNASDTLRDEMIDAEDVSSERRLELESRTALESALKAIIAQRDEALERVKRLEEAVLWSCHNEGRCVHCHKYEPDHASGCLILDILRRRQK